MCGSSCFCFDLHTEISQKADRSESVSRLFREFSWFCDPRQRLRKTQRQISFHSILRRCADYTQLHSSHASTFCVFLPGNSRAEFYSRGKPSMDRTELRQACCNTLPNNQFSSRMPICEPWNFRCSNRFKGKPEIRYVSGYQKTTGSVLLTVKPRLGS